MPRVKRVRHDRTFIATDEDGNEYVMHEYTTIIDAGTFDNPNAEVEGLKSIRTDSGQHANYLGKGKYQLLTGKILRSDDPDAP